MTNVKQHSLSVSNKFALTHQLIQFFQGSSGTKIFNDLCTEAEQIMLIKRMGTILLLEQGYSKYKVAKILQVSESTVARINTDRRNNHYKEIVKKLHNKNFDEKKFWQICSVLLRGGLPPRVGPGRWKHIIN